MRITPLLSIKTPLPEIGLSKPPVLVVQMTLTRAGLIFSLSSLKFVCLLGSIPGGKVATRAAGSLTTGTITFFLLEIIFCVVVGFGFSILIDVVAIIGEMFSVKFAGGVEVAEKMPITSPKKVENIPLKKSIRVITSILQETPKKVV